MVQNNLNDNPDSDESESNNQNEPRTSRGRQPARRQSSNRSQQSRGSAPFGMDTYRRGYRSRRKVCSFCVDKVKVIGWKDIDTLRHFVTDGGTMRSRRKTGTCAKHQRRLAVAIKRARHMALLPYTTEHVRIMGRG